MTIERRQLQTAAWVILFALTALHAEIVWFDGSRSPAPPAGKLLSDNEDYWGEVVLTGVTYAYETPPDAPADNRPDRVGRLGRVLLNGNRGAGVGLSGNRPLIVIFDFQRLCAFTEWSLITPTKQVAITLEMRTSAEEPWSVVYARSLEDCPDQEFHRIAFDEPAQGQFVRLSLTAPDKVELREIIAWGTADEEVPEAITPVAQGQYPVGIAYPTVTGIAKSAVSDRESFYWVQSLRPEHRQQEAVWAAAPTWAAITNRAVLPEPDSINQPVHIVMARNETEAQALVLKNTLVDGVRPVTVEWDELRTADGRPATDLTLNLGVFGVIGDRGFGNNLGPIFAPDNLLGASLMRKYLLNGAEIARFPELNLPPSAAAVLWLSVTGDDAQPGIYRSNLRIAGGERLPLTVEVLDVTLPMTFAHVKTYSTNQTNMFPFEYADRPERDINYALDCGISDWEVRRDLDTARALAAARDMRLLIKFGWLVTYPNQYYRFLRMQPGDATEDDAAAVAEHVRGVVQRAEEMGLSYDDWYGLIGDEPHENNIAGVSVMCRLIKQADPQVNIYVNPCYWTGFDHGGVSDDATVAAGLEGWYDRDVDISMPLMLLLRDRPLSWRRFSAPRMVNSYYYVSAHLDRSEQALEIQKYRRMAWNSFKWGFNGWAFYSYYSPRGSAWNHFDRHPRGEGLQEPSDYQMIYPGPRGVVPTRHSEALRKGWEDWRLLNLLREQGQEDFLADLLRRYDAGEDLAQLRLRALRAAAHAHKVGGE